MLTLLTYPAGFGQFSLSPFCVKAAYLLALSGQPWQRQDVTDPRRMPHRKLPVLRAPERLIADTDNIRRYLEDHGAAYDAQLTDLQKAQSRALIRMAEEHLYFHAVIDRWLNDDVWPTIRDFYFGQIPGILRGPVTNGLRKTLRKGLDTQGIGRFTPEERRARLEQDLEAIQIYLWEGPFLMGAQVSSADLSVAPMLDAMRSTPVETELTRRISDSAIFSDYLDRMKAAVPLP